MSFDAFQWLPSTIIAHCDSRSLVGSVWECPMSDHCSYYVSCSCISLNSKYKQSELSESSIPWSCQNLQFHEVLVDKIGTIKGMCPTQLTSAPKYFTHLGNVYNPHFEQADRINRVTMFVPKCGLEGSCCGFDWCIVDWSSCLRCRTTMKQCEVWALRLDNF